MIPKHKGLLGGTFDPIHRGHLHIAHEALGQLSLDQIQFIPVREPVHRALPLASAFDRLAMLRLALKEEEKCHINTIELDRKEASYTIDTLSTLADPSQTLYFLLGIDNFLQFNTWHRFDEILNYCHLIIVNRPPYDTPIPTALSAFYKKHLTTDRDLLKNTQAGHIFRMNISPCPISATSLRKAFAERNKKIEGLSESVQRYIEKRGLYRIDEKQD